ncbi:hypothetical protein J1N51_08980 [Psychrosphaera ytuae]|uniref:Thiamin/hydroxymethyl pyrimidine-binding YkoF putative domain-containing protein n=1 Tax=Psychrosphaera ytuae TaxID=2820710 RepID=A0A975HH77_9GAMM|nr:YkoF family thiamine/hydroxymethylpyrimidine-binding protein [Psychrosphaera ytuae]QTH62896.1 hypothetical protein J1N51_08980 [Psychrosphaera ytuae]
MKVSVEISKYPLTEADYVSAIQDFIDRVNTHSGIRVVTNLMSTQLFGDYDTVMNVLNKELKTSFEKHGTSVFVCKFIPGDLTEKYGQ